jgi:hypothetical protein
MAKTPDYHCPSCSFALASTAQACSTCGADLGPEAKWRPMPGGGKGPAPARLPKPPTTASAGQHLLADPRTGRALAVARWFFLAAAVALYIASLQMPLGPGGKYLASGFDALRGGWVAFVGLVLAGPAYLGPCIAWSSNLAALVAVVKSLRRQPAAFVWAGAACVMSLPALGAMTLPTPDGPVRMYVPGAAAHVWISAYLLLLLGALAGRALKAQHLGVDASLRTSA